MAFEFLARAARDASEGGEVAGRDGASAVPFGVLGEASREDVRAARFAEFATLGARRLVDRGVTRAHAPAAVRARHRAVLALGLVRRHESSFRAKRARRRRVFGILPGARRRLQTAPRPVVGHLPPTTAPSASVGTLRGSKLAPGHVLRFSVVLHRPAAPGHGARRESIRTRGAMRRALSAKHDRRTTIDAAAHPGKATRHALVPALVLVRGARFVRDGLDASLRVVDPSIDAVGVVENLESVAAEHERRGDFRASLVIGREVFRAEGAGVVVGGRAGDASSTVREAVVGDDGVEEDVAADAARDVGGWATDEDGGDASLGGEDARRLLGGDATGALDGVGDDGGDGGNLANQTDGRGEGDARRERVVDVGKRGRRVGREPRRHRGAGVGDELAQRAGVVGSVGRLGVGGGRRFRRVGVRGGFSRGAGRGGRGARGARGRERIRAHVPTLPLVVPREPKVEGLVEHVGDLRERHCAERRTRTPAAPIDAPTRRRACTDEGECDRRRRRDPRASFAFVPPARAVDRSKNGREKKTGARFALS